MHINLNITETSQEHALHHLAAQASGHQMTAALRCFGRKIDKTLAPKSTLVKTSNASEHGNKLI